MFLTINRIMDKEFLISNNIIMQSEMINPHFSRKVLNNDKWALMIYKKVEEYTNFLTSNHSFKERIFCICNNIRKLPVCKNCGNPTKLQYNRDIKSRSFTTFCSTKCAIPFRDECKILEKRKKTNTKLYGAENLMFLEQSKNKMKKTCLLNYNRKHPKQSHFSNDSYEILNNKEELKKLHHEQQLSMNAISYILGVNDGTIARYFKKHNIEKKYRTRSIGELQICSFLDTLGVKYKCNNRKLIGKELDIYIPEYNLAIEYCGLYWHADFNDGITKDSHQLKYKKCKEKNIQLLTIFEDEWNFKQEIVKSKLKYLLQKNKNNVEYARKCIVSTITTKEKKTFLDNYHIQGNGKGSISYCLKNKKNEIVACMTFIKTKRNEYELNRYATSCTVVGGFSKLLTHFKRNNEWNLIKSFADLRWSNGNLYETNNFTLDKILPPDYCYVDKSKRNRIHKFNFRHSKLKTYLKKYDATLTERENCDINKIPRLWDCGKLRYILINHKY